MLSGLCEYSKNEKILIKGLSKHWANVIEKTYIAPHRLYETLAVESFLSNRNDKYTDALKRALIALESCKVYRMSQEFEDLIKIEENSLKGEWYAIFDDETSTWDLAEKNFFDENGYVSECREDPNIPDSFTHVSETGIECVESLTVEEQREELKNFGFIVDGVPKWWWRR